MAINDQLEPAGYHVHSVQPKPAVHSQGSELSLADAPEAGAYVVRIHGGKDTTRGPQPGTVLGMMEVPVGDHQLKMIVTAAKTSGWWDHYRSHEDCMGEGSLQVSTDQCEECIKARNELSGAANLAAQHA